MTSILNQHKCSDNTMSSVTKNNLLDKLCENLQSQFANMSSSVLRVTELVVLKWRPEVQHCESMWFGL